MDGKMLLGVGRAVISPKVGAALFGYSPDHYSRSLNDDLTATAFFFKQNGESALMISATVCEINTELCTGIRKELAGEFGIPTERIMICATHTHSGPNTMGQFGWGDIDTEYCESIFIPGLREATRAALSSLKPVRVGVGVDKSLVGVNRREITSDGQVTLGQNPEGVFDPSMTVVKFVDASGDCIANIIHYGAHCTGSGQNVEITRDWAGVMIDRLEEVSGGITAFFNGPEGDIGPRLSNGLTVGNLGLALELGEIAARDAVGIYSSITRLSEPSLAFLSADTAVPLSPRIPFEEARAGYEQYKQYRVNSLAARGDHYRRVIESYENGEEELAFRYFPQMLIRVGEVLFVGFPYELFAEIGLRIAQGVKDVTVLSLALANGSDGYFVTEDQICRGGYEVDMFLYGRPQSYLGSSDAYLVGETLKNINNLMQEGN